MRFLCCKAYRVWEIEPQRDIESKFLFIAKSPCLNIFPEQGLCDRICYIIYGERESREGEGRREKNALVLVEPKPLQVNFHPRPPTPASCDLLSETMCKKAATLPSDDFFFTTG